MSVCAELIRAMCLRCGLPARPMVKNWLGCSPRPCAKGTTLLSQRHPCNGMRNLSSGPTESLQRICCLCIFANGCQGHLSFTNKMGWPCIRANLSVTAESS